MEGKIAWIMFMSKETKSLHPAAQSISNSKLLRFCQTLHCGAYPDIFFAKTNRITKSFARYSWEVAEYISQKKHIKFDVFQTF